jgi:hypothetical protein
MPQICIFAHLTIYKFDPLFVKHKIQLIFALLLTESAMAVTRLKRKNRKDKAKAAVRRQTLKIQNFKPVMKNVDIEAVKEEFKTKAKKK